MRECPTTLESIRAALFAARGVAVLRGVLSDSVSQSVLDLLSQLALPDASPSAIADAYSLAFRLLATAAIEDPVQGVADAWQAHMTARIVDDVNPWTAQVEQSLETPTAAGLAVQVQRDLSALRRLFDLDCDTICRLAIDAAQVPADPWVPWRDLASLMAGFDELNPRAAVRRRLATEADWQTIAPALENYWARQGTGIVARYHVMRWEAYSHTCRGIAEPDPVRLHELVGYDAAQAVLTRNVERFLNGLPAHDALLYGAPGTGKSSTVKAIANEFAASGLRLIEVRKEDLYDLPAIEAELRGRTPRFLLFVDDLSFEEHQTEYKALKALLEGSAEARPNNILIFATSNRRNLIRENFADRGSSDDVHGRDTLQEKISLAARFGLRVTFAAPDQDCYLDIAEAIARSRRLPLDSADVRSRALAWERRHPGRSGRLARQFVDDLEGELNGINNSSIAAEHIP